MPNATVMIENSERFGMTQLHQLRGRIGRGSRLLFCTKKKTPNADKKIKNYDIYLDGFII